MNDELLVDNYLTSCKYYYLHGLTISDMLLITVPFNGSKISVIFVPYKKSCEFREYILNQEEIYECDTVAIIHSLNHTSIEVNLVKTAISILYFANRMNLSREYISKCECFGESESSYHYFKNYEIDGFYTSDGIESCNWFVKIGKKSFDSDDFDRFMTSGYGTSLDGEYQRKARFNNRLDRTKYIQVTKELVDNICRITAKLEKNDEISKKLFSAFKLYLEILCGFLNTNHSIADMCTIFEVLLLKSDEDNQRKKVAVRAACLIADKMYFNKKRFIANQIYYFYKYRNKLIHDGDDSFVMDAQQEIIFNRIFSSMKTVIYSVISKLIELDVPSINEIKDNIVKSNVDMDSSFLSGENHKNNAFDYIDIETDDSSIIPSSKFYIFDD